MNDQSNIPVLTDLIEKGIEIKMSELGLDGELQDDANEVFSDDTEFEDTEIDITAPGSEAADPFRDNPALEQTIRRILDEHIELAWQEIKLVLQREIDKS